MRSLCIFLLTTLVIAVSTAPATDSPKCIPQNEECDPQVTHFHYGEVRCCASFQACVRQSDPTDTSTGYRCTPIFIIG